MVSDGDQPAAERLVREEHWSAVRYFTGPRTECWGNAQRMEGVKQATGDYLLFMDDDDVYRRDAFRSLRQATNDRPKPSSRSSNEAVRRNALATTSTRVRPGTHATVRRTQISRKDRVLANERPLRIGS